MDGQQKMLALVFLWISTVSGEYLFTIPRVMKAGSQTSYCLLLDDMNLEGFGNYQPFKVNIQLKYLSRDEGTERMTMHTDTFGTVNQNGDFYRCSIIKAPADEGRYSAVVNTTLTYTPEGESSEITVDIFGAEKDIEAKLPNLITLVQTDKPIYKPGQMVKFRVMTMDYMLMSKTDGYEQITIESPNGMRVMQWDNVSSPSGLVSLEMQLSSDPILGSWTIKVVHRSADIVQTFKVDEYVLPKFEVVVTPPRYLLPTSKQIAGTVCAKYTYGENVKGTVKLEVCYSSDYMYYGMSNSRPCAYRKLEIDGCHEFVIDAEEILLGYRTYSSWGSLKIQANVTEGQTGIELSGDSKGPQLTMYPLNLKIEDDSDNYFKPKFPYMGRVVVTNPDGSPAPGEQIRVKGYGNYNSPHVYTNNFTSDENGIVNFVINEFDEGAGFMNLNADAIVYQSDWRYTEDELFIRTYTPSAYLRLTKWYSPSDSYIYMPDIDEKAECDSELTLDVLFTAEPEEDYKFMAIVKAGDDVVYTTEKMVRAGENAWNLDSISFDESQTLNKELKPTPPPTLPPLPSLSPIPYDAELPELQPVVEEVIVPEMVQPLGSEGNPRKKRSGCAKNIRSDMDFVKCVMGFSEFMMTVDMTDQQSMMKVMCSKDGMAKMECLLDKMSTCPELLTDPESAGLFFAFTQMENLGGVEGVCNMINKKGPDSSLVGNFQLNIPVTRQMAPGAKVLVFYMRKDKEVVASSLNFKIKNCFKNQVTMSFDETTVRPGNSVNLNLSASPRSNCFVGMVDKSVNLLGGNNQLTPKEVFERVNQVARPYHYFSHWIEDRDYCEGKMGPKGPEDKHYYYGFYTSEGVDAVEAFRNVHMWVETDAQLETRPCVEQRSYYYMPMRRRLPGSPGIEMLDGQAPVQFEAMTDDMDTSLDLQEAEQPEPEQAPAVRTFFPETWLWDIVTLGGDLPGAEMSRLKSEPVERKPLLEMETLLTYSKEDVYKIEPVQTDIIRTLHVYNYDYDEVLSEDIVVASAPQPLDKGIEIKDTNDREPETVRSYFPETWLWDIFKIGDDGSYSLETTIPDTITEWVGNSVCTHESDGVGVTELSGVTAFQPFFVSLTLPYSAIRGEVLPVLATVFNYLSECITLKIAFRETEGFEFSDRSANSREFCLCGGESESTKFHIIPIIIGEIDLEVTAVSTRKTGLCENAVLGDLKEGVSDGVQRQLLIEPEGVPRDQTKSSYTCVKDGETTMETVEMNLPSDMVPDSERATVSVVGDIMGPTLSNLKNLVRMPYGCGEQNMASLTPNIYVLRYLDSIGKLTKAIGDEAKGYMRVGYQRQMKYRHSDYSYSAWGEVSYSGRKNNGSSWLTAYVVKSLAQASAFIVIDNDDIVRSARWLTETQEPNGCFPRIGQVFSSYLKGGLEGDNPAGLTTFILIALLEADLGEEFTSNITLGFTSCLDSSDVKTTDTYTLTVMLYAYTLYDIDGPRRAEVKAELKQRRIDKDGMSHWQRADEDTKEDDMYWWYRAPSAEVEMTSYVLMSIIAEEGDVFDEVMPIVQWLTKQRNPYGGFSSTQDTVVALQALSEFGKLTYSGETSVAIKIENRAVEHSFYVSVGNALVLQSEEVNPSQGALKISTSGTGCALIQVNMKYNVYTEESAGPAFDVEVSVFRAKAHNCARRTLDVCASYLKQGVSSMAIAEVKMPTGWKPVTSTLNELVKSNRIQRFEVENNYVQLYFDEFSRTRSCVDFDVEQEIEMNPKPALVRVYDYYEAGNTVTVKYSIKTTCGTKEEIPLDNEGLDCRYMQCRVLEEVELSRPRTCPSCLDTADNQQVETLVCNAKVVFKATVRRSGSYSIKLKSDLRPKTKVVEDRFVNYDMDESCSCPVVESGPETKAFVFSTSTDLFEYGDRMKLEEEQTILPYDSSYERTIRKIASRSNYCSKLFRLKRSGTRKSASRLRNLRQNLGVL